MSWSLVVGVDPGPVPGIVALHIRDQKVYDVDMAQVNADLAPKLLRLLIEPRLPYGPVVVATERFVVGPRSARSSSANAGRVTRDMVGLVDAVARELGAVSVQRTASQAKGWAVDERLAKAGLKTPTGMRHAKDATRHALYAACHAGLLPDPLSRAYKKPSTRS